MHESGEKVGEPNKALSAQLAAMQSQGDDTSCGFAEEGQDEVELTALAGGRSRLDSGSRQAGNASDGPIEV
jgi:hypothetical protein